ncbi:MAG: glycosyltransferase [Candidatus Dactylopiibacterium sp.]|nr:glycosyltransferase [Candidatus Dactylopiibacterium sp.]
MTRFLLATPTQPRRTKNGLNLGEALKALGHEVHYFDYDKLPWWLEVTPKPLRTRALERNAREWLNESLLQKVADIRPDVFMTVKGVQFFRETIVRIGDTGVQTAGYWIDDPLDNKRSMLNAGAFHLYLTNDKGSVPTYRGQGIGNAHYFPSAVDEAMFVPSPGPEENRISFVGTLSRRRLEVARQILDLDVRFYGPGWNKNSGLPAACTRGEVFGEQLVRVFSRSAINLNVHNWFGRGGAMNLRLFEVPAAGGFLLTDWVEEIDEHFVDGQHVVCWRSVEELSDKAAWYLGHDTERQRIARAGHEHVLRHHTYKRRAQDLVELLKHA